ncbi:hypothetical protein AOLI_G00036660 [Acnodon oligacanthus]
MVAIPAAVPEMLKCVAKYPQVPYLISGGVREQLGKSSTWRHAPYLSPDESVPNGNEPKVLPKNHAKLSPLLNLLYTRVQEIEKDG